MKDFTLAGANGSLNSIQDRVEGGGGGKKAPPTSFSPVASTNVGVSPKNFLTFSFLTLLPHWWKISSLDLVPVPHY